MADNFENIKRKFSTVFRNLPRVLANEAVNHSLDAFKSQSWEGEQWRRRLYRKGQRNGSILIKSGRGRRSIQVFSVSDRGFIYGTDVPYMAAHNQGFYGTVTVGAHTRTKFSRQKVGTGKFTKKGNERRKTVAVASGSYQVKSHTRRMNLPRRQFAGNGSMLRKRLSLKATTYIIKQLQ